EVFTCLEFRRVLFGSIAGLLEVVWAYAMKLSDGFTRLTPTLVTFGAMFFSFGLLAMAMKSLPLGTAYTVWTGIGAVGAFVVGIGSEERGVGEGGACER